MSTISLIANTGIQYYELQEELVIDLNANLMKPLRFLEFECLGKVYLDPVYYFPMHDKYLRRTDLKQAGYLHPVTNELSPEEEINDNMNWLDVDSLLTINRLDVTIGDRRLSALEQIEGKWLPLPYYLRDSSAAVNTPTNWCRVKLNPILEKTTRNQKTYKVILAFDTAGGQLRQDEKPFFQGEASLKYALCGLSTEEIDAMAPDMQKTVVTKLLPLKAYEFCDPNKHPWLNAYLQELLHSTNVQEIPTGSRMKYLVYYAYFICYLHQLRVLPDVKLYNDAGIETISTNLVLDVGNSRTFGLVAEDPLDTSFSKASIIGLRDLDTGSVYAEPFDMRLCFKEEVFGLSVGDDSFKWPSIVRLGKEASRNIYSGEQDLLSTMEFDTSYSSPKRFLWDSSPYTAQWKFVSEKDRVVGPARTVDFEGLMQQFHSDGSFAADPKEMGARSSYSRSSLMTFCFIEILLQVRMQINSVEFRLKNGQESQKREIKRVILTCPTAMSRREQLTLRRCMQEATIVLKRYYSKSYNIPYKAESDTDKVEIIPSVRDLSLKVYNYDDKRNWNYDEATCCQMVYMFGEMRRYLGNTQEFFRTYGRKRNADEFPSLTVASLDIGAGTTDMMICNYKDYGQSITPQPLFWESYQIAGDDLVKRIIIDVILDAPQQGYPEASGVITAKLQSMGCTDVSERMHHFFDDTANMGVIEKRMRKEFMVQVLTPIAHHLLDMLQRGKPEQVLRYEDLFPANKPARSLMDFFASQMGFRFEDLVIRYSPDFLDEIVRRVFEPMMRKWAAIFYTYKCDVVLLAGRPCSLQQIYRLLRRLYPVAPNRLISMNDYRVGAWYPGSSDIGHFKDKKSMVAVGALIAYLAENGKLDSFKINVESLKTHVLPTSEYIGIMNTQTGAVSNILTPDNNGDYKDISAFPICIGGKQLDVEGYPASMMYVLRFNEKRLRESALETVRVRAGLPADTLESNISPDRVADEIDRVKSRIRSKVPLTFRFEREYHEDKEWVRIDSVTDCNRDDLSPSLFELAQQTWAEDNTNWLDTGIFKLHIGF